MFFGFVNAQFIPSIRRGIPSFAVQRDIFVSFFGDVRMPLPEAGPDRGSDAPQSDRDQGDVAAREEPTSPIGSTSAYHSEDQGPPAPGFDRGDQPLETWISIENSADVVSIILKYLRYDHDKPIVFRHLETRCFLKFTLQDEGAHQRLKEFLCDVGNTHAFLSFSAENSLRSVALKTTLEHVPNNPLLLMVGKKSFDSADGLSQVMASLKEAIAVRNLPGSFPS